MTTNTAPDEVTRQAISDAFSIMQWAKENGTRETVEGQLITKVSIGLLHRSKKFCKSPKARLEKAIAMLGSIVVSREKEKAAEKGHKRMILSLVASNDEEVANEICKQLPEECFSVDEILQTKSENITATNPSKTPIYIQIPTPLSTKLQSHKFTPEEKSDIEDAYILWEWGSNNLLPEDGDLLGGRKISLTDALASVARFRNSPIQRLHNVADDWQRRGLGQRLEEDKCLIFESLLPVHDWEKESPTRKFYSQLELEAQTRVICKLVSPSEERKFPREPPAPMPTVLKAKYDFLVPSPQGTYFNVRKNDTFTDPIMIRYLIENGFPVIECGEDNMAVCSKCGTQNEIAPEDTSEEVSYLRPTRDFPGLFGGQVIPFKVTQVIENPVAKEYVNSGYPVIPVKRHEFILCKCCHKITYLKPLPA